MWKREKAGKRDKTTNKRDGRKTRQRVKSHLDEDGKYNDDEDCCLEQMLVRYVLDFEQRNQTERNGSTKSTIRLTQYNSFNVSRHS